MTLNRIISEQALPSRHAGLDKVWKRKKRTQGRQHSLRFIKRLQLNE